MTEIDEVRAEFEACFEAAMGDVTMPPDGSTEFDRWLFAKGYAAGRRQGLEEAAKATDKLAKRAVNRGSQIVDVACKECANAIRALIEKEPT